MTTRDDLLKSLSKYANECENENILALIRMLHSAVTGNLSITVIEDEPNYTMTIHVAKE